MTPVLLALRFILELALLAAFAVCGWRFGDQLWAGLLLAVVLPVAVATLWGLVLSPKARVQAPLLLRLATELALFGSAAALLWATELEAFAVVLIVGEVVVLGSLLASGQRPGREQLEP